MNQANSPEKTQINRRIQSFVLRQGRITPNQQQGLTQYLPIYGLQLDDGQINPAEVFNRSAPLTVEIGFGMGASLLEQAQTQPQVNFIGIEVHLPGVGKLLAEAGKLGLTNLKIYQADAVEVLTHCLAAQSINTLQIFFPDPWHKKKHHKRRLIKPEFIELVKKKLAPEGKLHLATDWQNYAEEMLEMLDNTAGLSNIAGRGNYSERPSSRPLTKFELRGKALGHGSWDLIYQTA